MSDVPERARVVIIGGGILGCSIAYWLTHYGETDVVLLEQHQLTDGATWHAAGLVGQLRSSRNTTRMLEQSVEMYRGLEAETGQAWPKDPKNGRNQDVSHKKPLADGGSNSVENIEPVPHSKHVRQHSEAGDFKRWGAQGGKPK